MNLWRSPRIALSVELEIQRLNAQNVAYGLLNRRKQEIRLLGSLEAICTLEQIILKSIDKILDESKMSVPISDVVGASCTSLFQCPLSDRLSLDITNRGMIVEGGFIDVKRIMSNVHKLQRLSSAGGNGDANDDLGTTLTVDDHVNKNLDSFQFCYTPGCLGICRLNTSSSPTSLTRLSYCSTCDTTFCTEYKVKNMKISLVNSIERLRSHLIVSE